MSSKGGSPLLAQVVDRKTLVPERAALFQPPGEICGLGTGGNAVTFLMICTSGPHSGLLFALKIFRKLSQPERRKRFLEEVNFLKNCSHPSIMRVFDQGVFTASDEDYPFVVAEYLPEGCSLDMMSFRGVCSNLL